MPVTSVKHTDDSRRDNARENHGRPAAPSGRAAEPCAAGGPQGPPWYPANSSSPAGQTGYESLGEVNAKAVRYATRRVLWEASSLKRVRACGKYAQTEDGDVGVRLTEGTEGRSAGFSGLTTCGSVWSCPVCSAKIAAQRARELEQLLDCYTQQGKSVAMVTMTMRHSVDQTLKECWGALSYAWDCVNSGKQWQADKETFDVDGYVRVAESTYGDVHGWHVHAHVLVVFDAEHGIETANYVGQQMFERWERALRRKGFDALRDSGGLDVRMADGYVKDYLTKTVYHEDPELRTYREQYEQAVQEQHHELAAEASMGAFKVAKRGNRTPFGILHAIIAGQELGWDTSVDERVWHEWEQSSKGRRQVLWSRGLRDKIGLNREKTDEEIAEEDELAGETVLRLPKQTWNVVRWEAEFFLQAIETDGVEGALAWLDQRHLPVEVTNSGRFYCHDQGQ